ncbi:MAG: ABC transporter permease [Mycobacteriales bacterium]
MGKFLLRRFVNYLILVILAASMTYILAGEALNPRAQFQAKTPPPPKASVDASLKTINANPDTPILVRYKRWVGGLLHGDFGKEINGGSVGADMKRRILVSTRLLLIATVLGSGLGILIGAYSAIKQYKFSDRVITLTSFVLLSLPLIPLAIGLKLLAVKVNGWVGHRVLEYTGEYAPDSHGWGRFTSRLQHLILPTLTLVLGQVAFYSRYQRATMLDVMGNDFLRTAQAKGLRRRKALMKHGLRTAVLPLVVLIVYNVSLLFTGAIFTETIFAWHGMGEWSVNSIQQSDVNVVAAIGIFTSCLILIAGMLSDIVYVSLDPRVRV